MRLVSDRKAEIVHMLRGLIQDVEEGDVIGIVAVVNHEESVGVEEAGEVQCDAMDKTFRLYSLRRDLDALEEATCDADDGIPC